MKIAVRYYSRGGNTKKLADAIAEAVGVEAANVSAPLTEKADILFLGSAVYAGGVDESIKTFVKENAANIGRLVNFSSSASGKTTFKKVNALAEANQVRMAKEEFYCHGKFLFMHRNRPNAEDLEKAKAFALDIVHKSE